MADGGADGGGREHCVQPVTDEEARDLYPLVWQMVRQSYVFQAHRADVVQEAMMHLAKYCSPIPPRGRYRALLARRAMLIGVRNLLGVGRYERGKYKLAVHTRALMESDDAPNDDDGAEMGAISSDNRALVRKVSSRMSARERAVVCWRSDGVTLSDAGIRMGVSRERARQIFNAATARARWGLSR